MTGVTAGGTLVSVNGAIVAKLSAHTVFDSNNITETRGYGIDCYDSAQVVIRNNTTNNAENGIWVEGSCPGYLIDNNQITGSKGAGIQVSNTVPGASPDGIIQRNFLSNNKSGIVLSTHLADNSTVRYNLIVNTKTSTTDGDIKVFLADNVKIFNNTLVNGGGNGISFYSSGSDVPDNSLVENNLVYNPKGYALLVGYNIVKYGTGNIWDHNSYYKPLGNLISWKGQDFSAGQFANYQQVNSQDAHSMITDPLFISSSDYRLQPLSPLINAGIDLGLNFDFTGNLLAQGSSDDIGAFEYILPTEPN
ncbi:MAG: right-handed parallel beta-helix repeat-containing protein [Anaerolineaceae bacterium]|nr:right-handed parallel beta-helix repeat-containing protein [Anaerolineaceae bacterium]